MGEEFYYGYALGSFVSFCGFMIATIAIGWSKGGKRR